MANYERALHSVFPFTIDAGPDELRRVARQLLEADENCPAGGSSFALVVRPRWRLYLSQASARRLGDPRSHVVDVRFFEVQCGYICKQCEGPSPVGIGYVAHGPEAAEASAGLKACACGYSAYRGD